MVELQHWPLACIRGQCRSCRLLALRDISQRGSNSAAFGAKRTSATGLRTEFMSTRFSWRPFAIPTRSICSGALQMPLDPLTYAPECARHLVSEKLSGSSTLARARRGARSPAPRSRQPGRPHCFVIAYAANRGRAMHAR